VQPLRRFHFGGNEVPKAKAAFTTSPACDKFRQRNTKELMNYFVKRVASIAKRLGVGLQVGPLPIHCPFTVSHNRAGRMPSPC
jgi:N-acetyl-beta-hexosaminidase